MKTKPRAIGTAAERSVVRYLAAHGWPAAERRSLKGALDQGDITGTPGLCWEVKGGAAAKTASDGQVAEWLAEALVEASNAGATFGFLVMQRAGYGPDRAGSWWAVLRAIDLAQIVGADLPLRGGCDYAPVRIHVATLVSLLRAVGYGDPLPVAQTASV